MFIKKLKYVTVNSRNPDVEQEHEEIIENVRHRISYWLCARTALQTLSLLLIYFIPSIGLTFYQRWLLQTLHFPLTIVLYHLIIKFVLAGFVRNIIRCWNPNTKQCVTLHWKEYCKVIAAIGISSGVDVGLSNWGLEFVTITLYTLTKSTTIVFILGCAVLLKLEKKSWSLCLIIAMISLGLFMFTYKATQFHKLGFLLLLLASFSSGIRWSCAQLVLQRFDWNLRNPIDTVFHVQPWMMISILPFVIIIEGPAIVSSCRLFRYSEWDLLIDSVWKITGGAFIAFTMEVSEFLLVTYTSSLTLAIGGIFKDMFMLILAVEVNGDELSLLNTFGLLVCFCGIVTHVIHKMRKVSKNHLHTHAYKQSYDDSALETDIPLISTKPDRNQFISDDSNDDEDSSTDIQELFHILKNRDDR